jgi:hypothetical protein
METINYWAVIGAAVINMIIGSLWYGPVFGKAWKRLMGFSDEATKSMSMTPLKAMILGTVSALVMAFVFAHIHIHSDIIPTQGIMTGIHTALWLWLGFVAPLTLGSVLWEGKSWKLWTLNAGYYFVALLVIGIAVNVFASY